MTPGKQRKTIRIPVALVDETGPEKRQAALIVLQGEEIGRDFRLRRSSMVIGRSPSADISLPDDRASREHARVDHEGSEKEGDLVYSITDLGSTNHTFLNGREVRSAQLSDGDKVQIGETILKFVLLDGIEAKFHTDVRDRISYDQLTGLLTKESLYLAFARELERCLSYGLPVAVLMMDLDRFKSVNDVHGHLMGSHVLSEVGGLIRQHFRSADVSARYGGEEFISYLTETDVSGAVLAAERVRRAIEAHTFTLDEVSVRVTISIGVSAAPGHGSTIKDLVGTADQALYRAKQSGRNRVCAAE